MKNIKRIVAGVAALVMCFTLNFSLSGSTVKAAEESKVYWTDEGNFTKDWVSIENGKDIYGHNGSVSDPYEIQNEQDLAALAYYSNLNTINFINKYINVTATELDMSANYWEPIGETRTFYGTINGNGCNINNLKMGYQYYYSKMYTGFIGMGGGDIYNVNLNNIKFISNSGFTGGLVGLWTMGTIDGCNVQGLIKSRNDGCSIGGLIGTGRAANGKSLGKLTNCSASVELVNPMKPRYICAAGGLIAALNSETTIENCTTNLQAEVSDSYYIGGLLGYVSAHSLLSNCTATYTISAQNGCYVGGLVGKVCSCTISATNCSENYNITNGTDLQVQGQN